MIPAFKLLTVFVKQLSKPLASYLKKRASNSDRFRRLCISIGNRGYAFDRYITRRFYNPEQGEPDTTPWLSPEKSVVIGTEMFGEVIDPFQRRYPSGYIGVRAQRAERE